MKRAEYVEAAYTVNLHFKVADIESCGISWDDVVRVRVGWGVLHMDMKDGSETTFYGVSDAVGDSGDSFSPHGAALAQKLVRDELKYPGEVNLLDADGCRQSINNA
jgi:hypothetical protein